mmetsp:Transcript_4722/g.14263  ORF Transcript_4722/g.14263 Transcript_4722/m.14263 type:complete len:284 (+) Transcript_4722:1771-2622(+)
MSCAISRSEPTRASSERSFSKSLPASSRSRAIKPISERSRLHSLSAPSSCVLSSAEAASLLSARATASAIATSAFSSLPGNSAIDRRTASISASASALSSREPIRNACCAASASSCASMAAEASLSISALVASRSASRPSIRSAKRASSLAACWASELACCALLSCARNSPVLASACFKLCLSESRSWSESVPSSGRDGGRAPTCAIGTRARHRCARQIRQAEVESERATAAVGTKSNSSTKRGRGGRIRSGESGGERLVGCGGLLCSAENEEERRRGERARE